MGTPAQIAQVFHRVPKPVSIIEFKDALDAICRPRFPAAVWGRTRWPALAISGGVDSMALAFLFSKFQKMFPNYTIADYPSSRAHAIVVDHGLREGSDLESMKVLRQLNRLGLNGIRNVLKWKDVREAGMEPHDLSNIESEARTRRYQQLGMTCRQRFVSSIFLAHHRDDQYETVLMRLLSGHGYRGLQGMREANDIPECYGMHNTHKSGLLDDQKSPHPYLSFKPSVKVLRSLRHRLKDDKRGEEDQVPIAWKSIDSMHFHGYIPHEREPGVPYLTPLQCEDGGVTVYRPLLEFDKDRLIATCEANDVSWSEDKTNSDKTLTMRNAVRHMVQHHTLPAALQKPAILSLARSAKRRVDLEDSEANRLLIREAIIREFDPCSGTLIIQPPTLNRKRRPRNRLYDRARAEARKPRQKLIAALAIRKMIDFITPNENLPPIGNLDNVVLLLFPELGRAHTASPSTSFSLGGVLFDPIKGSSPAKWFLSRAPYPSKQPVPEEWIDWREGITATRRFEKDPNWSGWRRFPTARLWDGRYWIQIQSLLPDRFYIRPFVPEHAKPFRAALTPDQRERLEAILKHYAPGKVRFTLPGIYMAEMEGSFPHAPVKKLTLVALPTLNIHLPGSKKWLKYEVSYKKIDLSLLGRRRRGAKKRLIGFQPTCSQSRRVRNRRRQARVGIRQKNPRFKDEPTASHEGGGLST